MPVIILPVPDPDNQNFIQFIARAEYLCRRTEQNGGEMDKEGTINRIGSILVQCRMIRKDIQNSNITMNVMTFQDLAVCVLDLEWPVERCLRELNTAFLDANGLPIYIQMRMMFYLNKHLYNGKHFRRHLTNFLRKDHELRRQFTLLFAPENDGLDDRVVPPSEFDEIVNFLEFYSSLH